MPQTFDPPQPTDRPICASCGWTMWFARIEQHLPGHERHVYKCERCEAQQEIIVKL